MKKWRIILAALVCIALISGTLAGCGTTQSQPSVALMPLDSRPCNTQYPTLLAAELNTPLSLPAEESMDSFTTDADREALWEWLENDAIKSKHLIIFTNTLFCGGLINSRNSDAYATVNADLARLKALCKAFKEKQVDGTITVVQVLPRLTPNQYDEALAPYSKALKAYGIAWDEADAQGNVPLAPDTVPADVLATYRALHENAGAMASALDDMAANGLIDRLLISQDDGEVACPANVTFRALEKTKSANTALIHGADELGMLLVVSAAANDAESTPVHVIYSDDSAKKDCYPFEAVPLETMVTEKLALAGLTPTTDESAPTLYIHCKSEDAAKTIDALDGNTVIFGLADIAKTNQADPALTDALTDRTNFDALDAYAGWNTAGNSIGTVCAMLRANALIADCFENLSNKERKEAASADLQFRAIRYAEDIGFMANIRIPLQTELATGHYMKDTTAFVNDAATEHAITRLAEQYAGFNDILTPLFNGDHTLSFGPHTYDCTIENFTSGLTFPWPRAFEVKADISMEMK